jgi:hypothetical protein
MIPDSLDEYIENWRLRFIREGFDFDDIEEVGIYPLLLTPFRRHNSRKRDQREFNAVPMTYLDEIDLTAIEDYSRACYEHFKLQEQAVMRQTLEKYSIVLFPVIVSPNVDSIAISHIQRYHHDHGDNVEVPLIYDLDLDMVYIRRGNPGKGDPFFDPYRTEVEFLLKG